MPSQNGGDIISSTTSRLATILHSAWSRIRAMINDNIPPETRENLKQNLALFARSRPILATLLLSQLAFSSIPLLVFVSLTAALFIFSLVAALIFGVLGALMVTLFCMGLGSLILVPILFVTTLTAGGVWLWGWGLYYVVQWIGSGDTALLTRLSLLLVPQRPQEKSDSGFERLGEQKEDVGEAAVASVNASTSAHSIAPVQHSEQDLQSQATKDRNSDAQVSTESDGYLEKQVNGLDAVNMVAL